MKVNDLINATVEYITSEKEMNELKEKYELAQARYSKAKTVLDTIASKANGVNILDTEDTNKKVVKKINKPIASPKPSDNIPGNAFRFSENFGRVKGYFAEVFDKDRKFDGEAVFSTHELRDAIVKRIGIAIEPQGLSSMLGYLHQYGAITRLDDGKWVANREKLDEYLEPSVE